MEQELGKRLPENIEVSVLEESADTIYLGLPIASAVGEGEELSDRQLEEVAGGLLEYGQSVDGGGCETPAFGCI